jgi:hypothetical protein
MHKVMYLHLQGLITLLHTAVNNIVACLQVLLTPTCRVSGYARQVIKVDAA